MTLETFRPVGAPYWTTSLTGFFGDTSGSPAPTFTGSGSWSDDSDATGVAITATPSSAESAVVAADFAAIPNLAIPASGNPKFGAMMRVTLTGAAGDLATSGLAPMGLFALDGTNWISMASPFPVSSAIGTPTTYTTAPDFYTLFGGAAQAQSVGFTFAFGLFWPGGIAGTVECSAFELALTFETAEPVPYAAAPPIRRVQRPDGLAIGGVPRHAQVNTRQGSLRRGPGSIL